MRIEFTQLDKGVYTHLLDTPGYHLDAGTKAYFSDIGQCSTLKLYFQGKHLKCTYLIPKWRYEPECQNSHSFEQICKVWPISCNEMLSYLGVYVGKYILFPSFLAGKFSLT